MAVTMTCTSSCLYIRDKADPSGNKIGIITYGQETQFIESVDGESTTWIKHNYNGIIGYSVAQFLEVKYTEEMVSAQVEADQVEGGGTGGNTNTGGEGDTQPSTAVALGTDDATEEITDEDWYQGGEQKIDPRHFNMILGLPYHFLSVADPGGIGADEDDEYSGFGSEYSERILSRCPIMFISPGTAKFMSSYKKSDKASILSRLITGDDAASLNELLSGNTNGRYYSFKYDRVNYYKYVNPMCRIAAVYLDIANRTFDGKSLSSLNWGDYTKDKMTALFGATGEYASIPFYLDGETSISESFSNQSTESSLASTVNGVSDTARELNYLLGYTQSATDVSLLDLSSATEELTSYISKLVGKSSFISKLSSHLSTVATGGKMIFPKIWGSSNFNRSYSVSLKLVSPDKDPYSLYLNILVPLFHAICLAAPHEVTKDPNSYTSPFLVRCMYKGFFNIDLGLVTGLSITKGEEGQWTPNGVPTVVNVSMDIEDLYDIMSITPSESLSYSSVDNTALMDYIQTMCGIEVFTPDIGRSISAWIVNKKGTITDALTGNLWGNVQNTIVNKIMSIYT